VIDGIIKNKKNLLEKIKRCCTAISKFNLNSPCLLQFIRVNGEYEVIITHNPTNGDRYDFYKIFSTVTRDSFHIPEDDVNCFSCGDDRVSVPIIISSYDFVNKGNSKTNLVYYSNLNYDLCIDSFYIFPKYVLKAIKEDQIYDFRVVQRTFTGPIYTFNMDIIYNNTDDRYKNVLFIRNSEKLDFLYNLYILPFGYRKTPITDIFLNWNSECASFLQLDSKLWEEEFNRNRNVGAIKMMGKGNEPMVIYHHDFLQKKIVSGLITKRYEAQLNNIATLYFNIELPNNVYEYFMYKYYDI
jgi:hypothetical protein